MALVKHCKHMQTHQRTSTTLQFKHNIMHAVLAVVNISSLSRVLSQGLMGRKNTAPHPFVLRVHFNVALLFPRLVFIASDFVSLGCWRVAPHLFILKVIV